MTERAKQPKIYLDCDGVLLVGNADSDSQSLALPEPIESFCGGYYSEQIIDGVRNLGKAGAELVWLTTWGEYSPDLTKEFGFNQNMRYFSYTQADYDNYCLGLNWKMKKIENDVNDSPFVWVDDKHTDESYEFVAKSFSQPSLIITPKSTHGLTLDHITQIDQFLNDIKARQ